jgi:hypothetical protein
MGKLRIGTEMKCKLGNDFVAFYSWYKNYVTVAGDEEILE